MTAPQYPEMTFKAQPTDESLGYICLRFLRKIKLIHIHLWTDIFWSRIIMTEVRCRKWIRFYMWEEEKSDFLSVVIFMVHSILLSRHSPSTGENVWPALNRLHCSFHACSFAYPLQSLVYSCRLSLHSIYPYFSSLDFIHLDEIIRTNPNTKINGIYELRGLRSSPESTSVIDVSLTNRIGI